MTVVAGLLGVGYRIEDGVIGSVMATDTHRAIEAVWRIESARPIGGLARIVRDVGLAEDLAPRIHCLSSGPLDRGASCAHTSLARGSDD